MVRALHAEAFLRRVQRLEVRGQLLAQLRGLGVGARHRHAAFRIRDTRAFIELFDAALGGGECACAAPR